MKRRSDKDKSRKNDPLKAYRFTAVLRHVLSACYGILLGFAVMAGNRTINLIFILATVLFAYILIKTICGRFLVKTRQFDGTRDVTRETPAIISFEIHNYSPFFFPVSYIQIKDSVYPEGQRVFFCLRPFSGVLVPVEVRFNHCGVYCLRPDALRLHSAGGMVWTRARVPKKEVKTINIVPELRFSSVNAKVFGSSGDSSSVQKNSLSPTDSFFLRQYSPGDDPRYIHWKRSASREDWLAKGFYEEGNIRYAVVFDNSIPGGLLRNYSLSRNSGKASVPVPAISQELSDKLSSAAVSICQTLINDGVNFNFIYRDTQKDPSGDEFSLVSGDTFFGKIRNLSGTLDFAHSDDNGLETADPAFLTRLRAVLPPCEGIQVVIRLRIISAAPAEDNTLLHPDRSVLSIEGLSDLRIIAEDLSDYYLITAEVRQ